MTKKRPLGCTPGTRPGPGYVYVLHCPDHKRLKVGGTRDPARRLKELRMVFGYTAQYVAVWRVADVPAFERRAHEICIAWRLRGMTEQYKPHTDWLGDYDVVRLISGLTAG